MDIVASKRVRSIGGYAFAEVDNEVVKLNAKGITPIDFGVGDPTVPTPEFIRNAIKSGLDKRKSAGYPSYIGVQEYRETICEWISKRFGVSVDPNTEVSSTIGSKEAVFNIAEGFVDPGDYVIIPSPGYPPAGRGTLFAEGQPYYYPLLKENNFLPDLGSIPESILDKTKVMWINYPNNPCGVSAPLDFLKEVVEFGVRHNIIIISDEAYIDLFFGDEPAHSILEVTKDNVAAIFSMSKRSAMTCHRIGCVVGDERILDVFKKVKTNIDSGTATFIQDGAIAALKDETHVEAFRQQYKVKRDIMVEAFKSVGLPDCTPDSTIYIWQECPDGMTSVDFATKLLSPEVAIVTTPGTWISDEVSDGTNPGEGYVRFALVPSIDETIEAADKIKNLKL
ncbi:MAG: aminotransferase class I/II-fold pyridoxal phosphate-dependent enzyme [Candidatus Anammoxibacter sp.]